MAKSRSLCVPVVDADAADDAMASVDPDASDETIAGIVADYLLTTLLLPRGCHLSVIHDVRPRELAKLVRMRQRNPDCYWPDHVGPCPLPYDWSYKNTVGISTRDRDRARRWIIDATLAGYCVFRNSRRGGCGGGQGSLADIRKRRREDIEREANRRHHRLLADEGGGNGASLS